jgi:bifunctional non-homologous end joining protein LigD
VPARDEPLEIRAGRRRVRITHPSRVLFPADGITKADLAAYYAEVAPAMLPHVRDRPINLWRWPRGIDHERIVQQEIPRGAPEWVRRVRVPRRKGGSVCHVVGGEAATLVWLANLSAITPHVWTARADRPDQPDRMIFDLDPPDEAGAFEAVRAGALALGDLLRELGLEPFAMTTGSKGVHVVTPLRRGPDSDTVRAAAGAIGEELAGRHPDTLTTAWRKAGRGGRVLVDTARNTYAQTVVAPYAVRALARAPVATPLVWEELQDPGLHPQRWTLRSVGERLAERGDAWREIGRAAARLPRVAA